MRISSFRRWLSISCMLLAFWAPLTAQEEQKEIDTTVPPPIKDLGGGLFEIEGIRLDQNTSSITIPGKIEITSGMLEYAIVNEQGKVHEALLSTVSQPYYLHVGMLLLGVRETKNHPASPPPGQITAEYLATAPKLDGDKITITVSWTLPDGTLVEKPVEELILEMEKPMKQGAWIYNGSMLFRGRFLAQEDRSIAALITDPSALVNTLSPDRDKENAWTVNEKALPPANTPVQIRFHLPKQPQGGE